VRCSAVWETAPPCAFHHESALGFRALVHIACAREPKKMRLGRGTISRRFTGTTYDFAQIHRDDGGREVLRFLAAPKIGSATVIQRAVVGSVLAGLALGRTSADTVSFSLTISCDQAASMFLPAGVIFWEDAQCPKSS
jgi:hypothetical protein